MPTIHWLGAGLSAVPGIRRLASGGRNLTLWNRTLAKAEAALDGAGGSAQAKQLDWAQLSREVSAGDVLVSMLPATLHMQVAEICLGKSAHFVSSSYVSPQMQNLSDRAKQSSLCFLNEVGLDPGIDHLMAHALVADYKSSPHFDKSNSHSFRSYCGGLSKIPNDFKYKFSWSPLGVLRALTNEANWVADGEVQTSKCVWESLSDYTIALGRNEETFQSYPNRNSLPYREEYGFEKDWNIQEFVRGTLRLNGWSEAWKDIFAMVASTEGAERESQLASKSDELWEKYRLKEGDPDRVVLAVELEVSRDDQVVFHQRQQLDEVGNERGTAMSRLVSLTTSLGVEAVLDGNIAAGVSAAPSDMATVDQWLSKLQEFGEQIEKVVLV